MQYKRPPRSYRPRRSWNARLAGTFRSHLLETGKVNERVIRKDELAKCSKIFLVNSVRKWAEVDFPIPD